MCVCAHDPSPVYDSSSSVEGDLFLRFRSLRSFFGRDWWVLEDFGAGLAFSWGRCGCWGGLGGVSDMGDEASAAFGFGEA